MCGCRNLRAIRIPNENGVPNGNDLYRVSLTIAAPANLVLDAAGNLYIDDTTNAAVTKIVRTAGLLPLGSADTSTTSAQLTAQIGSAGNQSLIFGTPLYTAAGTTGSFTVSSPSSGGCAAGQTLTGGFTCSLAAVFTPACDRRGDRYADLLQQCEEHVDSTTRTDRNRDESAENHHHRGCDLACRHAGLWPVCYGDRDADIYIDGTAPTGTVTFVLDGQPQYPAQTLSAGSTASFTLGALNAGVHVVAVSYSGDSNYASSTGSFSFTVSKAGTTTSLGIGAAFSNPASGVSGSTTTLTATVVPSTATPTDWPGELLQRQHADRHGNSNAERHHLHRYLYNGCAAGRHSLSDSGLCGRCEL